MKSCPNKFVLATLTLLAVTGFGSAQVYRTAGKAITPTSSIEKGADVGLRAHTNIKYVQPSKFASNQVTPNIGPPFSGYLYETPASLACIYRLVPQSAGCNPNTVLTNVSAGSRAIAIVDAYDYPTAAADLAVYTAQFGLPTPNFSVVYAGGVQPPQDTTGGWELEEALDISMAAAMAPNAKIYLVEAQSNSFQDLLNAEALASSLVAAAGGGQVSNSWGSSEFLGETSFDSSFVTPGVTYFFSSGDGVLAQYPAASQNVVAVGGTSVIRNQTTGAFGTERSWIFAGSGPSQVVHRPAFQNGIANITQDHRGVPDLSAVADPNTGVWVYATNVNGTGWYVFGGTSVAAPLVASLVNAAGSFAASSVDENNIIYGQIGNSANFRDITIGSCWQYPHKTALTGWDFCTGVGSPLGYAGK